MRVRRGSLGDSVILAKSCPPLKLNTDLNGANDGTASEERE